MYRYESAPEHLENCDEYGHSLAKRFSPKRIRGEKVLTRKKKMAKNSPKSNKEMKG